MLFGIIITKEGDKMIASIDHVDLKRDIKLIKEDMLKLMDKIDDHEQKIINLHALVIKHKKGE